MHHGQNGRLKINILITGHRGYIGSVLVPALLRTGFNNLVGMDTNLYNSSSFFNYTPDIPENNKDVRDISADDLDGIDTIIHLAGLSNDPLGNLDPDLTFRINYEATIRMAELAKKAGVKRFIFASSCSIYGSSKQETVNEESDTYPVTPYAESKLLSEQGLSSLADTKFCPVYLRNATAYGDSPNIRFDLVLNNLVAWAVTSGKIFLKSDGTSWRPLVHIDDICRAILLMITAPCETIRNQIFNIGTNAENYRVIDLANIIKESIPGMKIVFADDKQHDIRSYKVNFDKMCTLFPEFQTEKTVRTAIPELCNSFKKNNLSTTAEFEGPRYSRIECIKSLIRDKSLSTDLRWVN